MTAEEKELWNPTDLDSNPAPLPSSYVAPDKPFHSSHVSVSSSVKREYFPPLAGKYLTEIQQEFSKLSTLSIPMFAGFPPRGNL